MRKLVNICGLVAISALLLAACGGSSISKEELVKRGDAICVQAKKDQLAAIKKALNEEGERQRGEAGMEQLIATIAIPPYQKAAEEIGELGAPNGEEEEVEAIVTGMEGAVKKTEQNPALVNNFAKSPFTPVNKLARKYGFKVCSRIP